MSQQLALSKKCPGCNAKKQSADFAKNSSRNDGLQDYCRSCASKQASERWATYDAKKRASIYGTNREGRREANRKYYKRRAAEIKLSKKKYRALRPEVIAAHKAVHKAIAKGLLHKKPCEKCNSQDSQAHHDDYSKPLDVRWLCPLHHNQHHNQGESNGNSSTAPGSEEAFATTASGPATVEW